MTFLLELFLDGRWQPVDMAARAIVPGPIVSHHLQQYDFSFFHRTLADVQEWPHLTPVRFTEISAAGVATVRFLGRIERTASKGVNRDAGIDYVCSTWWHALSMATLKLSGIPRIAYNCRSDDFLYDADRVGFTVQQILQDGWSLVKTEVQAWCTEHFLTAPPNDLVFASSLNVVPGRLVLEGATFQEFLVRALSAMPDAFLQFAPSTGAMTFTRRADLPSANVTLQNNDNPANATVVNYVRMNPRLDLVVPRMKLHFPIREEKWEGWIDTDQTLGTPNYLAGIPITITQLDDLRFQLSSRPVHQLIEVIGASYKSFSLATGIFAFRDGTPANFYARYLAQTGVYTHDTGLGGTAYSEFGLDTPVIERYLDDFPIVTRKFQVVGIDGDWMILAGFPEVFADPDTWPALLTKAVTIPGKGASTIAEVAVHAILGLTTVAIRLEEAIEDAAAADWASIVTEDNTAAVIALADSVWKALRDVHWAGEIPAVRWMPELTVGTRLNLLNTNDPRLARMAEPLLRVSLDPKNRKTNLQLASNPWADLDTLLSWLREKMPASLFTASPSGGSATAASQMQVHKHDGTSAAEGGDQLNPDQVYMAGATGASGEIRVGANGTVMTTGRFIVGNTGGDYAEVSSDGIAIYKGGKSIILGVQGGVLSFTIDGIEYLFTHSSKRKLGAKVQ